MTNSNKQNVFLARICGDFVSSERYAAMTDSERSVLLTSILLSRRGKSRVEQVKALCRYNFESSLSRLQEIDAIWLDEDLSSLTINSSIISRELSTDRVKKCREIKKAQKMASSIIKSIIDHGMVNANSVVSDEKSKPKQPDPQTCPSNFENHVPAPSSNEQFSVFVFDEVATDNTNESVADRINCASEEQKVDAIVDITEKIEELQKPDVSQVFFEIEQEFLKMESEQMNENDNHMTESPKTESHFEPMPVAAQEFEVEEDSGWGIEEPAENPLSAQKQREDIKSEQLEEPEKNPLTVSEAKEMKAAKPAKVTKVTKVTKPKRSEIQAGLIEIVLPEFVKPFIWEQFKLSRIQNKEKMNDYAEYLMIDYITKLHEKGVDVNSGLNDAIMNNWLKPIDPTKPAPWEKKDSKVNQAKERAQQLKEKARGGVSL